MEGFSYNKNSLLEKYDSVPTTSSDKLVDSGDIKSYVDQEVASGVQLVSSEIDSLSANVSLTSSKVDNMIDRVGNPFVFKGTVAALSNLPSSGNTVNDTYFVEAEGFMYTWNGTSFSKNSTDVNNQLANDIATAYSGTKADYKQGDIVMYNNQVYVRKNDASAAEGTFVSSNWNAVSLGDEITDLKSTLTSITANEICRDFIVGEYITTSGDTVDINSTTTNALFAYVVINCSEGDCFTITGAGGGNPRLYAFAGAESNGTRPILLKADANESVTNQYVFAPENAEKLIVNMRVAQPYLLIIRKRIGNLPGELESFKSNATQALTPLKIDWIDGRVYNKYSASGVNTLYKCTDPICIKPFMGIHYSVEINQDTAIVLYNNEKTKVGVITGSVSSPGNLKGFISSDNYGYVSFTTFKASTVSYLYFGSIKDDYDPSDGTEYFEHDDATNFIKSFYSNAYVSGGSTRKGLLRDYTGFYATHPVELDDNSNYYYSGLHNKYYAFFDDNMNWISGAENTNSDTALTSPFTPPEGTKYGIFTALSESDMNNSWISGNNSKPSAYGYTANNLKIIENDVNPLDYTGKEVSTFFYGIAVGDSLTEGTFNTQSGFANHQQYSYPFCFYKQTGVLLRNFGSGGRTAQQWYEEHQSFSLSYDMAIIALGVNDLLQGVTPSTTVDYIGRIVTALKVPNPDIKCFISTVNKAYKTSQTHNLSDWEAMNTAIRTFVSGTAGCYLLDIATYGKTDQGTSFVNGHLTAIGYNELAREYASGISWHIAQNPSDFDAIQFSGTDINNIPSDLRTVLRVLH